MRFGNLDRKSLTPIVITVLLAEVALCVAIVASESLHRGEFVLPSFRPYWSLYPVVGLIWTLFALPPLRSMLTLQEGPGGLVRQVLYANTFALIPLISFAFLTNPETSGSLFIYFYASVILLDFAFRRFWISRGPQTGPVRRRWGERIGRYFDEMPHAPFVIAAVVLLGLCPFYLIAKAEPSAERLANWAYGFLVLGVSGALLQIISFPTRVKEWAGRVPEALLAGLLLLFYGLGFFLEVTPEVTISAPGGPGVEYIAQYLKINATGEDVVIFDFDEPPLKRYYGGPAKVLKFQVDKNGPQAWEGLQKALQGKRHVFLVQMPGEIHDPQRALPFFLEMNGTLVEAVDEPASVKAYQLTQPVGQTMLLPFSTDLGIINFDVLQVEGVYFQKTAPAQSAISVALRCKLVKKVDKDYKVILVLMDERARRINSADYFLTNAAGQWTSKWAPTSEVVDYYLLPIPLGTPPLAYTLALGLYEESDLSGLSFLDEAGALVGKRFVLGTVQVQPPLDFALDPYRTYGTLALNPLNELLAGGLALEGYSLDATVALPGEKIGITLAWHAMQSDLPDYEIHLQLRQGQIVVAEARGRPVQEQYPTSSWTEGEKVVDRWDLQIPPEAEGGPAIVTVRVDEQPSVPIASIMIQPVERLFTIPEIGHPFQASFGHFASLLGYDLDDSRVSTQGKVKLTLYWQAINEEPVETTYTVFTQLLSSEGRLVAQHDSLPAYGLRPTTSWVKGEVVVDEHELELLDPSYEGEGSLIVGFYSAVDMRRVKVDGISDDHVTLPDKVYVEPAD